MAKHLKLEVHEARIAGWGRSPGESRAKGARKVSEQFAVDRERNTKCVWEREWGRVERWLVLFPVIYLLTTSLLLFFLRTCFLSCENQATLQEINSQFDHETLWTTRLCGQHQDHFMVPWLRSLSGVPSQRHSRKKKTQTSNSRQTDNTVSSIFTPKVTENGIQWILVCMETTCSVNYYRSCNFCKTHSSMCDQLSPPSLFTSPPPLFAHHRPASFPNTSLSLPQFATIIHRTISSVWSRHAVSLRQ